MKTTRKKKRLLAASLAACVWSACRADILLAGITEAGGPGAAAGTSFRQGYQMAIDEINASGGLLGHRLVLRQFDIDTTAEAAAAAARSAVEARPFAILGPVFSDTGAAAMSPTAGSGIPHFIGGEAASLGRRLHPSLLRTSLTQQGAVPRLAALAIHGLGARRLAALWIDNDFGRDSRALLSDAASRRGAALVFDAAVAPGRQEVAELVSAALQARPDALVLYLNEGEAAAALKELRRQGYLGPVLGEGALAAPRTVEAARDAAEGVLAHTAIPVHADGAPGAQMEKFLAQYQVRHSARADHHAVKGYFAVQVLKVGLEKTGRPDPAAFLEKIKTTRLDGRAHPALMTSVSYDLFGNLNRDSHFLRVQGGKVRRVGTLHAAIDTGFVELPDGRSLVLNSDEFRRELKAPAGQGDAVEARPGTRSGR